MPTEYAVRDSYDDDYLAFFDSYEDASEYIESHQQDINGEATNLTIITRTVSEWTPA